MDYAVITNGVVSNVILLDESEEPTIAEATGWMLVKLGEQYKQDGIINPDYIYTKIGWLYNEKTGKFSAPGDADISGS